MNFKKKQQYCLMLMKTSKQALFDTEVMQIQKLHGSQIKKRNEEKWGIHSVYSFAEEN